MQLLPTNSNAAHHDFDNTDYRHRRNHSGSAPKQQCAFSNRDTGSYSVLLRFEEAAALADASTPYRERGRPGSSHRLRLRSGSRSTRHIDHHSKRKIRLPPAHHPLHPHGQLTHLTARNTIEASTHG